MLDAFNVISRRKNPCAREAYEVPRRIVTDRVIGRVDPGPTRGGPTALPGDEERAL